MIKQHKLRKIMYSYTVAMNFKKIRLGSNSLGMKNYIQRR